MMTDPTGPPNSMITFYQCFPFISFPILFLFYHHQANYLPSKKKNPPRVEEVSLFFSLYIIIEGSKNILLPQYLYNKKKYQLNRKLYQQSPMDKGRNGIRYSGCSSLDNLQLIKLNTVLDPAKQQYLKKRDRTPQKISLGRKEGNEYEPAEYVLDFLINKNRIEVEEEPNSLQSKEPSSEKEKKQSSDTCTFAQPSVNLFSAMSIEKQADPSLNWAKIQIFQFFESLGYEQIDLVHVEPINSLPVLLEYLISQFKLIIKHLHNKIIHLNKMQKVLKHENNKSFQVIYEKAIKVQALEREIKEQKQLQEQTQRQLEKEKLKNNQLLRELSEKKLNIVKSATNSDILAQGKQKPKNKEKEKSSKDLLVIKKQDLLDQIEQIEQKIREQETKKRLIQLQKLSKQWKQYSQSMIQKYENQLAIKDETIASLEKNISKQSPEG